MGIITKLRIIEDGRIVLSKLIKIISIEILADRVDVIFNIVSKKDTGVLNNKILVANMPMMNYRWAFKESFLGNEEVLCYNYVNDKKKYFIIREKDIIDDIDSIKNFERKSELEKQINELVNKLNELNNEYRSINI